MTTARTQTIEALTSVIADSKDMLDRAITLNERIRAARLPVRQLDITAIWKTQEAAEVMLKEMELRAGVAA